MKWNNFCDLFYAIDAHQSNWCFCCTELMADTHHRCTDAHVLNVYFEFVHGQRVNQPNSETNRFERKQKNISIIVITVETEGKGRHIDVHIISPSITICSCVIANNCHFDSENRTISNPCTGRNCPREKVVYWDLRDYGWIVEKIAGFWFSNVEYGNLWSEISVLVWFQFPKCSVQSEPYKRTFIHVDIKTANVRISLDNDHCELSSSSVSKWFYFYREYVVASSSVSCTVHTFRFIMIYP